MKINKVIIKNYKGIKDETEIIFNDFNCIVGKNDVGKSTILKAIYSFFNDKNICNDDKNVLSESDVIEIGIVFNKTNKKVIIDDAIDVTFSEEELVDENDCIRLKKTWDLSQKTIKPKIHLYRKIYDVDDFEMLKEKELIACCDKYDIETQKGNGDNFNNKEKRDKLREHHKGFNYHYGYEELPTTGQTRQKKVLDAIKELLPKFEYFEADTSLSDSDASIQRFFKEKAYKLLKNEINTDIIENNIRENISITLNTITDKINQIVPEEEKVEAHIDFDWSKLVSTSFRCKEEEKSIPLNARGDGFRRITMMSYFEMLAEENDLDDNDENNEHDKNLIYGFEEPETFLHPEAQRLLYSKLVGMKENGYQIIVTTHSPNIVAETNISDIIYVKKQNNIYTVCQSQEGHEAVDVAKIVNDLGIKSNDALLKVFDNIDALLLLEGVDDVIAINHIASVYKEKGMIDKTFDEMKILLLPIGGCGAIEHWNNLQIIKKINKPYFILLDSDKENAAMESPNLSKLHSMGYSPENSAVTKRREIENYITPDYFHRIYKDIDIDYGEWDDVKMICKRHALRTKLGGHNVCRKHFRYLTFEELRKTLCPDNEHDEFIEIYNRIKNFFKNK